jgi:alpha-amylase/alpha-mannosidase (GH57 family)
MSGPDGDRYVCVHGHFYQPPRENPWLDAVEVQDSAAPYHDWNERITAECYGPNATARVLDADGWIAALRNNYAHISFNVGPTLLSWMERARPDVYRRVLDADRDSLRRLGRGNAVAQAFGHCIMPLASQRDQATQVRWGIADFVHRFGRRPDGMWLPETAVDRGTLRVLADHGIRFTILAPYQAARVRYADHGWADVVGGRIDCTRPYRCALDGGREIALFFYDAEIARAVAFEGLLNDGRALAARLAGATVSRNGPVLVNIATDGESYGHHHRFGEMALSAAIEALARDGQVQLTNYAAYLDRAPLQDDVEVRDNSAWSCAHGVERWRSNCGCNSGLHPGWTQAWRGPLREALDWMKGQLDDVYERAGGRVLRDPWAARDAYIEVLLAPDGDRRRAFLETHARRAGGARDATRIWKLLELQRHGLLAFTSCGWFFDECSGIETVQILTYAARALQLAGEIGADLEPEFLRRLEAMRSNLATFADGRDVYRTLVLPQRTDHARLLAHYAINGLFTPPKPDTHVYACRMRSLDRRAEHAGSANFAVGHARVLAEATQEREDYMYAALHLGGHDIHCAVVPQPEAAEYHRLKDELFDTFFAEPLTELLRRIDRAFGQRFYTLRDVFAAERRQILDQVTARVMGDCTADYERIVTDNRRVLDFLAQANVPLPDALRVAASFVLQRRLETAAAAFAGGADAADAALTAWTDARRWGVVVPGDGVSRILEDGLDLAVGRIVDGATDDGIGRAHAILDLAQHLDLALEMRGAQDRYYALLTATTDRVWPASAVAGLRRLGERLRFRLPEWERLAVRAG